MLDRFTEEAVAFIDRSAGQENPFFLYFALTAPHVPLIPESRFVGTTGLGYYGDFVAQIDWIVGQVLDALDRAGIADDTLLVFTSDNGSPMEDRPNWLADHHVTNPSADWYWSTVHKPNGDWRGIKSTIYEGGHRVPYLVQWPGVVPAGSETAFTFAHVDLYATVADILGHRLDDEEALDSLSILPVHARPTGHAAQIGRQPLGKGHVRRSERPVEARARQRWRWLGRVWFHWDALRPPLQTLRPVKHPVGGRRTSSKNRARAPTNSKSGSRRSVPARSGRNCTRTTLRWSALALSGIEIGEFAGEVWGYSAQVANKVTSTTVTATPADEYATVVISDGTNSTVGTEATVELREGGNTIMVTVTAEDMVHNGDLRGSRRPRKRRYGGPGTPRCVPGDHERVELHGGGGRDRSGDADGDRHRHPGFGPDLVPQRWRRPGEVHHHQLRSAGLGGRRRISRLRTTGTLTASIRSRCR